MPYQPEVHRKVHILTCVATLFYFVIKKKFVIPVPEAYFIIISHIGHKH